MESADIERVLTEIRNFMNEFKAAYDRNYAQVGWCDNKCNDLVHRLELEDLSYHEQAKLAGEHRAVLKDRRTSKDAVALLAPVVKWLETAEVKRR